MLATAMELPASNATEVMTMQYRFNLKNSVGVSLSEDQKNRLGQYKLRSFGGRVPPMSTIPAPTRSTTRSGPTVVRRMLTVTRLPG